MATEIRQIQVRRDTAANWTANNPVLAVGEIGYETDTDQFKIGDGVTPWTSKTDYYVPGAGSSIPFVAASASGPASLDFHEDTDNGTNKIRVIGQSVLGADRTITLPDETGTLATRAYADAMAIGGAVSGGGANRILYEDGSQNLASDADFTFASDVLTLPTSAGVSTLSITTAGDPNTGLAFWGSDAMTFISGGVAQVGFVGTEFNAGSGFHYGFNPNPTAFAAGNDASITRGGAAKFVRFADGGSGGGGFHLIEMTAPAAPAANGMYAWVEDNGSGKTRWMVQFGSGSPIQMAIEP